MSVWTKVQSKVLHEKVDMELFKEAMQDLNITLDFGTKEIQNSYGRSKVDAMVKVKGNKTALGIVVKANKGLDLVGDSWQSGIVGAHQEEKLVNMMSQAYQKVKLKKELELQGWEVQTVVKNNKVVLECVQF